MCQHCGELCLWHHPNTCTWIIALQKDMPFVMFTLLYFLLTANTVQIGADITIILLYNLLFSITYLLHGSVVHSPTTSRCTKRTFLDPGYLIYIYSIMIHFIIYLPLLLRQGGREIVRNTRWKVIPDSQSEKLTVLNIINKHIATLFDIWIYRFSDTK